MKLDKEEVIDELDLLIQEGNSVIATPWNPIDYGIISAHTYVNVDIFSSWHTKILTFLDLILPNDNQYIQKFGEIKQNKLANAKTCINLLKDIKEYINKNYIALQDNSKTAIKSNNVFIVHGHNDTMKLAVVSVISKLGLEPVILHEQPNRSRTIIEKFECLSQDVSFAVVLLSADDKVGNSKYRARQNVVLELGYFIAKLGRENVIALYDNSSNEIEIPSDISGVLYEPYDKPDGAWRYKVVQELKAAGFPVDANALV